MHPSLVGDSSPLPLGSDVFLNQEKTAEHLGSLDSLLQGSGETLFETQAIFPFDFVPDRLLVDMAKVTILYREFFGMGTEHTILLNEIRDVDVETGLLTANLRILVSGPGVLWTGIEYLHKHDAMAAKHLIEGLLIARAEHCDLRGLSMPERVSKLSALGKWNHMLGK
jgi:hypothetical protein